jgi:serine/threonine protein kinase
MIGLISLGVLTSLDLRRGLVKVVLGFVVALLASVYAIAHSVIGQGLAPLLYGDWSLLLVSLPPSLGVVVGGFLLPRITRHKMVKANLLASLTLVIGLGLGSAFKASVNQSLDSVIVTSLYFVALGLPANIAQMFLLHFLDKLWKTRNISLAMMPTAFFSLNLLNVLGYLASRNLGQLYTFFSSLGFLPALALAGVGSSMIAKNGSGTVGSGMPAKKSSGPVNIPGPTITVTGSPVVRQGEDQNIKIATGSSGQPQNMASIKATIKKPGGKVEFLRLSRIAAGVYRAFYRPRGEPGDHIVKISATSKEHLTKDKSFSFTVQPPPAPNLPPQTTPKPASSKPAPLKPGPQIRTPQTPPPPPPRPVMPAAEYGLSRLDSWDPKVWVNQEVHGYRVKEHLATGLTGYILRASFEHGGTEMAIKIPILRTGIGTTALDETMSEASKLLDLSGQSKYIVQLRGILVDRLTVQEIIKGDTALYLKSPPAIIMEFMKGGTAKRLLEDSSYEPLYYSEKWSGIVMLIGHMIATGLETIHRDGFVHLDIKPQNILFNVKPPVTGQEMMSQMQSGALLPKLADLGSAVKTGGKVGQFTSEYAPGEQVLGTGARSSMDIYALGATIYNMLSKTPVNSRKLIDRMNDTIRSPGSGKTADELRSAWNSFTPDFTRIDPKSSSIIPVLKEMLAKNPENRPPAAAVASSLRSLADKQGSRK